MKIFKIYYLILIFVLIFNGCGTTENTVVCNDPYMQIGVNCCLDQNYNKICDSDEYKRVENSGVSPSEITEPYCGDSLCRGYENLNCEDCRSSEYARINYEDNIRLVCKRPCPYTEEFFNEFSQGADDGVKALLNLLGTSFKIRTPLDVHISYDSICLKPDEGEGGRFVYDPQTGFSDICTHYSQWLDESKIQDIKTFSNKKEHGIEIHEATHALFENRIEKFYSYKIEEPLANGLSAKLTYNPESSLCDDSFNNEYYNFVYILCTNFDFDYDNLPELFDSIDNKVNQVGRPLTIKEFKEVLDGVVGMDTSKAFESVDISLN